MYGFYSLYKIHVETHMSVGSLYFKIEHLSQDSFYKSMIVNIVSQFSFSYFSKLFPMTEEFNPNHL